jgi:hypothetical protein
MHFQGEVMDVLIFRLKSTRILSALVSFSITPPYLLRLQSFFFSRSSLKKMTMSSVNNASESFVKLHSIPDKTYTSADSLLQSFTLSYQQIHENQFPLGWTKVNYTYANASEIAQLRAIPGLPKHKSGQWWAYISVLFYKICGVAFTVLAITIGAPFWFDILGGIVKLRASGSPAQNTQAVVEK